MISLDTVNHIAKLAKLNLSDDEKLKMQKQISNILSYIDKIQILDLSGVSSNFGYSHLDTNRFQENNNRLKDFDFKTFANHSKNYKDGFIVTKKVLDIE